MIGSYELEKLLSEYGVDANNVVIKNNKVLTYGEYQEIKSVLEFLVRECGISPRNIEKCPSLLYQNVTCVKQNYGLLKKRISPEKINMALHVLGTDTEEFKKSLDYVIENYGMDRLNKALSVLRINKKRIEKLEEVIEYRCK